MFVSDMFQVMPWFPDDLSQLPREAQRRMLAELVAYVTHSADSVERVPPPRPPSYVALCFIMISSVFALFLFIVVTNVTYRVAHFVTLDLPPPPTVPNPRSRRLRPSSAPLTPRGVIPKESTQRRESKPPVPKLPIGALLSQVAGIGMSTG